MVDRPLSLGVQRRPLVEALEVGVECRIGPPIEPRIAEAIVRIEPSADPFEQLEPGLAVPAQEAALHQPERCDELLHGILTSTASGDGEFPTCSPKSTEDQQRRDQVDDHGGQGDSSRAIESRQDDVSDDVGHEIHRAEGQ